MHCEFQLQNGWSNDKERFVHNTYQVKRLDSILKQKNINPRLHIYCSVSDVRNSVLCS